MSVSNASASTLETLGNYGQIIIPLSAAMIALANQDKLGIIQLTKSYTATMAVAYTLKYLIRERRPHGGPHSFPSGHTASAFAGAAFLQRRYGWKYGGLAYLAATLVGYSRVESKNHWVHDVIAGAALGIGFNLLFTKRYHRVSILPYADANGAGIMISMRW